MGDTKLGASQSIQSLTGQGWLHWRGDDRASRGERCPQRDLALGGHMIQLDTSAVAQLGAGRK